MEVKKEGLLGAHNRPLPSSPGPLYQNEVKSSAFDMEMIFFSLASKTHFHRKGLCTWPHFESEGFWDLEVAYSVCEGNKIESCLTCTFLSGSYKRLPCTLLTVFAF